MGGAWVCSTLHGSPLAIASDRDAGHSKRTVHATVTSLSDWVRDAPDNVDANSVEQISSSSSSVQIEGEQAVQERAGRGERKSKRRRSSNRSRSRSAERDCRGPAATSSALPASPSTLGSAREHRNINQRHYDSDGLS